MNLDPSKFTSVMGTFPTGVAVITSTDDKGAPYGITSNSLCSVSLDPPLLLFCVAHTSQTLPIVLKSGRFAVNFLAEGQGNISNRFARKGPDKFHCIRWRMSDLGNVILDDHIIAYAECILHEEIVAGDHVIIVGRAVEGGGPDKTEHPLLYFRRRYDQWPVPVAADHSMAALERERPLERPRERVASR